MNRWLLCTSLSLLFAGCLCVQQASAQFKKIITIAGNGQAEGYRPSGAAKEIPLTNPFGIQQESDGDLIIVSFDQHVLYRLDASYSKLTTIAGTGAKGFSGKSGDYPTQVMLNAPHEVQIHSQGNVLVADTLNHRVGLIDHQTKRWRNIAGTGQAGFSGDNGPATGALLDQAYSIAVDNDLLFIADLANQRIRRVELSSGKISTICGNGKKQSPTHGGRASEQPLAGPRSLAVDEDNLWIVLREGNSVWRIDRRDDCIYHVAGSGEKGFSGDGGDARLARLNGPKGIAVDPGVAVYIADTENHAIRQVDLKSGKISTLVGSPVGTAGFNGDGDALQSRLLRRPHGVCLLRSGEIVIGDSENHRVRMLVP